MMKTAAILAVLLILTIAGLWTAFGHPSTPVDLVRTGYLEYNKTTTVGNALEHTFSNGQWKAFKTDKGVTVVEFDGSRPFFTGNLDEGQTPNCDINLICNALFAKFRQVCANAPETDFRNSCIYKIVQKNASDPVPVTIQFSLNADGTFQYLANDTYSNPVELFETIYN